MSKTMVRSAQLVQTSEAISMCLYSDAERKEKISKLPSSAQTYPHRLSFPLVTIQGAAPE